VVQDKWEALLGPGPDAPLFGRQFDLAQFAWITALEPACLLYQSDEIPGPYPDSPKGWGGANLSGYSNPMFDEVCRQARNSLPGSLVYAAALQQLQSIFAEDLPVLPLYPRIRLVAMRPDMCGVVVDPVSNSALSHLEAFDYGTHCEN